MRIDREAVAALSEHRIGPEHKSMPPTAWGLTVREFLGTAPCLDDLQTPLLTLERAALDTDLAVLGQWARTSGVELAPHGKTTMAPRLWAEQVDAGYWGLTLATPWQVQVARSFGVDRVLLANEPVDPVGLRWLAEEITRDPAFELYCWADDVVTVAMLEAAVRRAAEAIDVSGAEVTDVSAAEVTDVSAVEVADVSAVEVADVSAAVVTGASVAREPRLRVVVELGAVGARTGARGVEAGLAVARAVHEADHLVLAGVAGYEGILGADRGATSRARVETLLADMARLHELIAGRGWYPGPAIVTAGGSAYQDIVADRLARLAGGTVATTVVSRSGAALIHDDGFYAGISPLSAERADAPLRSAMHGWARIVSRPEPGLALLDAGKRDLPYDKGFPTPQRIGARPAPATSEIVGMDDQHAYLRLPPDFDPVVGEVVRLGLSHPCTAFDKWRLIPVIDDATAARPRVVELVHTFF